MPEAFLKAFQAIATGQAGGKLGLNSPHLPGAITRIGRFLYTTSGLWILLCWYSGYVNEHTQPGEGPKLVLPGSKIINGPSRDDPTPGGWLVAGGTALGTGVGKAFAGAGRANTSKRVSGKGPFPGATASQLDQGIDLTSNFFGAPDRSQIVYVAASDPGWQGGGYVAGRLLAGPYRGMVWYMAEGITPTVKQGQVVNQFQSVGKPRQSPYSSGGFGTIETGWANSRVPKQPLAQVVNNPVASVLQYYHYILSLGGPVAAATAGAGYASGASPNVKPYG